MPFCPKCRSEFRPGFTTCNTCGGVALVDELVEVRPLDPGELEDTLPVGFTEGGSGRGVEVDGRMIDPSRVFILDRATRVRDSLAEVDIPSLIVPLEDVYFPDNVPRFEVRVRAADQARAEKTLVELWREDLDFEAAEAATDIDIEHCPACRAKVPLDQEECPDCGLVIGTGAERGGVQAEET